MCATSGRELGRNHERYYLAAATLSRWLASPRSSSTATVDPTVIVDGPGMELYFQQVDSEPSSKNRVHLDAQTDHLMAEVDRLVALGATVRHAFPAHTWMLDPEGNDFCVVQCQPPG